MDPFTAALNFANTILEYNLAVFNAMPQPSKEAIAEQHAKFALDLGNWILNLSKART